MTSDSRVQPPRPTAPPRRDADLLQTVLDCVDVVWEQDADRRITYMSAGITDLTGYSPEHFVGRRLHELPGVALMPGFLDRARAAFAAREPYRDRRMTITHRNGSHRLIAVSGRPVFDEAGEFQGYRGIAIEISETVRAETLFRQIATTVRDHVGEDYLQTLVRAMAEALGVDRVFVGRIDGARRDRIRSIAVHQTGGPAANFEYDMAGTPCLPVRCGKLCLYPSGVAAQFPADRTLAERGIEAYCGLPLFDVHGQPIGLLVVQSAAPFRDPDLVCSVAQVFTGRAALEIERQSTEAQLRQNQELLIESQRLGKLGYILSDTPSDRVVWSDTVFELRRVERRESFTFDEAMAFIHPEDRQEFLKVRDQAIAARRNFAFDMRVLHGDGTIGWEHSIGRPRFDDNGNCIGALVLLQDITEAMEAKAALRRREADLRTIMDNAPLMIFLKDRAGRYRLANRAYAEFLGFTPTAIPGRTVDDVVPLPLAAELKADDRAVLERGATITREFQTARLGHTRDPEHLLFTKFPILDETGAVAGIAGFAYDITKRKRAEDALRASEERFRALIEQSNDMVLVVRPDGVVTYRSPSSTRELLFSTEDVVGQPLFDRLHPDDMPAFAAAFRRAAGGPGGVATGRCRVRHKDGSWRHIAWSARNATDVPAVDGVIINSRDVTEAVELEEQLRQAQKMEAVGQLAGGIAHDFNNIIGAILGFAGFLTEDLAAGSREHHYAERIIGAGAKAKELVQHILAFSRRSGVERQAQDLAALVRGAEGLLRAALPSSTRLELTIDDAPLIANVNAVQIDQVLLNLCVNANDALAGEPGTIAIRVSRATQDDAGEPDRAPDALDRVAMGSLAVGAPYARITVADTGTGMSAAIMDRIFDPFFTTKARGRGTGLGLSIVHGVVTDYGGACRVESAPGRGTSFSIFIPLDTGEPPPADALPAEADVRGDEAVLIVDDEADVADMLAIGLGRLGYRVTAIADPAAALTAVERNQGAWDVVVSDQVMPGIKGMTLIARMKAIQPALRFILCTGFSDGATEAQALASGVDAYFLKPVSPEQIAASIRRIVAA